MKVLKAITRKDAAPDSPLMQRLLGMNKGELDAVARCRGASAQFPTWYSATQLRDWLIQPWSVSSALRDLSPSERSILDFLVVSSGRASIAEIAAEMRVAPGEVLKLAGGLRDRLLVGWSAAVEEVFLYSEFLSLIPVSEDYTNRLRFLLSQLDSDMLRGVAQVLGMQKSQPAAIIRECVSNFRQYSKLQSALEALPEDLRSVINDVAVQGGRAVLPSQTKPQKQLIARIATGVPFVFLFGNGASGPREYIVVVPYEIQRAIQCGFLDIPREPGSALAAFLKAQSCGVRRSDEYQDRAEYDLIRLGLHMARGEARLTQQESIAAADIKKLQKRFAGAGNGYARFLLALARTRGWYEFAGSLSKMTPKFLADASSYEWKDLCLQTWIETKNWSERCEPGYGDPDSARLPAARRSVLELLLECTEQEWLTVNRIVLALEERHSELQTNGRNTAVHRILMESLAWIGIVEAGEDTGGLPHIRLVQGAQEMIRPALAGQMRARPQPDGAGADGAAITVQPTGEIVALDGLNVKLLLKLSAFAEPQTIDRASLFNLTRQSLFAALEQGADATGIVRFLEAQSGRPLPPAAAQLFADAGGTAWSVGLAGYIVTAPSPEALDNLAARPPHGWTVSRIAPAVAAIELRGSAADILAGLKKLGIRAVPESSLDRDYPPRLLWKPIQSPSHLRELLRDLGAKHGSAEALPSRDDILRTLDQAMEEGSTVSIEYRPSSKTTAKRTVLEVCDFDERKVVGFDEADRDHEIPIDRIVSVRISGRQEEVPL